MWNDTYRKILSDSQFDYMMEMMYSIPSLQKQKRENHIFILIYYDDLPVGFASYELNCQNLPQTKIHKLYVLKEFQGKGIGKKVIDSIEKTAKLENQECLILNVNRFNEALFFYKKAGFEIVYQEDVDIGNGYLMEDFVMRKLIRE